METPEPTSSQNVPPVDDGRQALPAEALSAWMRPGAASDGDDELPTQYLPAVPAETFPVGPVGAADQQPQPSPVYSRDPVTGPVQPEQQYPDYRPSNSPAQSYQPGYQSYQPGYQQGRPADYQQPDATAYLPPVYGQPPSYEPTAYQPTGYQPQAYPQPSDQQPFQQQPSYQQPPYQQPGYQQPSYQHPGYQQPSYPAYQQPGYQQAGYQQAGYPYPDQTAYGQPAGPGHASRKNRGGKGPWIVVVVTALVIAAVLVVLFVAPGVAVTKKLSHTAVQSTITSQSGGRYTNVMCNNGADVRLKSGRTFTCTAAGGTQIEVTMTDGKGTYTWTALN